MATALRFHEAATILPMMRGDEWQAFLADIRENQVRKPVVFYLDKKGRKVYIDGRNRLTAARELNEKEGLDIQVPEEEYDGDPDRILQYVLSENLQGRRHLTSSQRAACAVKGCAIAMEDGSYVQPEGDWAQALAFSSGSNRPYVFKARRLLENAPNLLDKVIAGEMAVNEAFDAWKASQKDKSDKKPKEDAGEEGGTGGVTDAFGNEVPPQFSGVFASRNLFTTFAAKMAELKDALRDVVGSMGSEYLDDAEANALVATLESQVRAAVPHALCPDCEGSGKVKGKTCKRCQKRGYVTEARYNAEATAAAEESHRQEGKAEKKPRKKPAAEDADEAGVNGHVEQPALLSE